MAQFGMQPGIILLREGTDTSQVSFIECVAVLYSLGSCVDCQHGQETKSVLSSGVPGLTWTRLSALSCPFTALFQHNTW